MNIFISGPRSIRQLNNSITERLHNIYEKNLTVLVGDANGADKAMQKYFADLNYSNVIVFAASDKTRNNIGHWQVENIEVPKGLKGFEFYSVKDQAMAEKAAFAFMIWNGESRGTLNNIINMIKLNKKSIVYFIPKSSFICINTFKTLESLLALCSDETKSIYKNLNNTKDIFVAENQMPLFQNDCDII